MVNIKYMVPKLTTSVYNETTLKDKKNFKGEYNE